MSAFTTCDVAGVRARRGRARWIAGVACALLLPFLGQVSDAQTRGERALVSMAWLGEADKPSFAELQTLGDVSTATLLQRLNAEDNLALNRPVVWALAMQAHPAGAAALRQLLTNDYDQRQLAENEEQTLLDSVRLLGFFAGHDSQSFDFLVERTHPAVWAETVRWRSSRGDYLRDLLTSFSIQALGISTAAEVASTLGRLRERPASYLHKFAGDIVQADFYRHLRARYGEVGMLRYLADGDDQRTEFRNWSERDGRGSVEWANEMMRGPAPEAGSLAATLTSCTCKQTAKTCGKYCNYTFSCKKGTKTCNVEMNGISNNDSSALALAVDKCDTEAVCE